MSNPDVDSIFKLLLIKQIFEENKYQGQCSKIRCGFGQELSLKPIGASSICSSKPVFGSSVRASKPICAINVRVSKPVSEYNSVTDVCPSEPIDSS